MTGRGGREGREGFTLPGVSERTIDEPFETALAAILNELADPERQAAAASEAAMLLEAAVRWPPSNGEQSLYEDMIRPELRDRPLTRQESERIAGHIHEQLRKLPPRPIDQPGTALPWALGKAESEIAVPLLLDLIVHHWKRLTTAELDQLLKGLEYHLWCAGSEPTYVLVEQLRGFPGLRKTLRRIAHRHLGKVDVVTDVPAMADVVDGEVGALLAPEELRSIRHDTAWLRRLDGSGDWVDVARSLIPASHQSIYQCVVATRWQERQGRDAATVLVLTPNDNVYQLELEADEYGAVSSVRWERLSEVQRADQDDTVQRLKRVQRIEQEEREQLGRVPKDSEADGLRRSDERTA
jgi:hypothetical protein